MCGKIPLFLCMGEIKTNTSLVSRAPSTRIRIFLNSQLFFFLFPDFKISPSTSSVLKSNSLVCTHLMVSGFTLEKLGQYTGLPEIDSKNSHYTVHTLSDSLRFFFLFLTLDIGYKNIRIRCRIRQCGRKPNSQIQKYPDTC